MAVAASTCLALSWAPAVAIAHEAGDAGAGIGGAAALAADVSSDNGLPKTIEYQKVTGEIESGQTYSLVTTTATAGSGKTEYRILHYTDGAAALDKCKTSAHSDVLSPADCTAGNFAGTGAHQWTIEAVEGGYTVKSNTASGKYLNISAGGATPGDEAQVLKVERMDDGSFSIGREVSGTMYYFAFNNTANGSWKVSTDPYGFVAYKKTEVTPNVIPNDKPASGVTYDQPYASGTAGSQYFRIPSLITLKDGSLLSAIDARWTTLGDAGGLDTIVSKSTDGGKTWNYSFPNYFNDSTNAYNSHATAFIDPVMVEREGTVYMMVDLWPGGVALNSAANNHPVNASGYVEIDGEQRLVLFASPNPDTQRSVGAERGTGYTHYVGDFGADGYAPVIKADGGATEFYVDREYFLFDENKDPVYCQQLGSSDYVQQNVFYFNADLHVTATSYLWLVSSSDGGASWSDPMMLNEQVRTSVDKNDCFYGVGPGRGVVTSTGRIILPCYTYEYGKGDGHTSTIYSDDGVTWHRSNNLQNQTSESTVVEADGRLYLFARHGWYAVSTDNGVTWRDEKSLPASGLTIDTGCQINAITYSEKIDGKTAIILSCPSASRRINGTINVGLVQDDGGISWDYTFDVTKNGTWFAYSSMTELPDGSIGILYETKQTAASADSITYESFSIEDIAPNAEIGNERNVSVPLYGEIEFEIEGSLKGYENVDTAILGIKVEDNGDGTSTVTFEGKREGVVEFVDPASGVSYTVTVAPEKLVEVVVSPGESTTLGVNGVEIAHKPDESIASIEVTSQKLSEAWGEIPGSLGSDNSFAGEAIRLSDALFTFTANGENWTVSGTTQDGETAYLKIEKAGLPGQGQAGVIQLKFEANNLFRLYDTSTKKHLHFWRDGKACFDQCGGNDLAGDSMELYRPAKEGEDASTSPIPGYVRVTDAAQVVDGGQYLIVASVGEERFVLNPSLGVGNKYAHVVKVDPGRTEQRLKVTGVAPGVTDAMVGDTVCRITVAGYLAPEFVWSDDYSEATATFKHTAGGETQELACKVTSVRTEPTETKDGLVVYTAEVEFEGNVYRDEKRVVLPAIGEQEPGGGTSGATDQKPNSSTGSNGGASLPRTGDPVTIVGLLGAAGISLSAIGARLFRRKN